MLSPLHSSATPLQLRPPSHQPSPYCPVSKRATVPAVLADASNSPVGDRPPVAICNPSGVDLLKRSPFVTQPLAVRNSNSENTSAAIPDTPPNTATGHSSSSPDTYPCTVFPVHGPFDLLHCLQTGGFGAAWAAKDRSTGRLLCLKVFQSVQNPEVSRSVRTELTAFRRMVKSKRGKQGKQFIMELNRSMQLGTEVFFAMELMALDLGSYFFLEPERCKFHARRWMVQMALGIQSLHEMGIIHRDIKTENMLIDSRENIRIIDFGLAYLGPIAKPLRSSEFLGTPPYMAPEVLQNKDLSPDERTHYGTEVDWWALGCIFFELESQDHQILFDTEEDVCAYVTWALSKRDQMYTRFKGLDPIAVGLLEGLLRVQPSSRFSLSDLERHVYFRCRDGTSEFDNAAARARARTVCPELVLQFEEDRQPIKLVEVVEAGTSNDWTNLRCALVDT